MRRLPMLGLAFGLILGAAPLAAQSFADATASIEVTDGGNITVVKTQDMSFGTRASGTTVRSSDVGAYAAWGVTLGSAGQYSVSFTLPTSLQRSGGGSVPISFGPNAASSPQIQGIPAWDPSAPIGIEAQGEGGEFFVELGKDALNDASGDAIVSLAGAPSGLYTGVITLTVAVFD
ncbi:MAG: hypothetical protein M3Y31_08445 [Gemmatimonadota bacterium]|nr:hypothetical protein [Gemmatimonadota bacterium]